MKRVIVIPVIFLISGILVFFAIYQYWLNFGELPLSNSVEHWGQFGDYIGGVLNPSLSFISIILVCLTLYSTSRQSSIQSFESILFELLRFHKENLLNIKIIYGGDINKDELTIYGKDALEWYLKEVNFNLFLIEDDEDILKERVKRAVDSAYLENGGFSNLAHYFRNIYHIFKHIDQSDFLSEKEKIKYSKLVRAQLSSTESFAILFNGLSSYGAASVKFIEKYSLLQSIDFKDPKINKLEEFNVLNLYSSQSYEDPKGQ